MTDFDFYSYVINEICGNKPNWLVYNPPIPIVKKEKIMSTVKFMGKKSSVKSYQFKELEPMTMFRIVGHKAVYLKVGPVKHTFDHYMLEVATGKLFAPTPSRVEIVNGEVLVYEDLPDIY